MRVELTADECRAAAYAGIHRRLDCIARGRTEIHGAAAGGDYWTIDIEAAAGELAVAKALGVFWVGDTDPITDRHGGDVAGLQVRHTRRPDGSLILHDRDHDHHVFVLVVGAMPAFTIPGWIHGANGKQPEFWRQPPRVPRAAFFVPQSALTPLAPAQPAAAA
ncbi:MAG TPA: hypothetical protein VFT50_09310 [Baekduia sp.]|nr:hypothetical protein [Baekduia sp.]